MKLHHYYHVYAIGDEWEDIVVEHFEALWHYGLQQVLDGPVHVGVVGEMADRYRMWKLCQALGADVDAVNFGPSTWEQATLYPMWRNAASQDGLVLYAHTKGAANPSPRNHEWRRRMTDLLVGDWLKCVSLMRDGTVDLVGAYRIVNDGEAQNAFGDGADYVAAQLNKELGTDIEVGPRFPEVGQAIFAGNFWWANYSWIKSLLAPRLESRYDAETWVGGPNRNGALPLVHSVEKWEAR